MLYWCGIRVGELLALTPSNFNFNNKTVTISKYAISTNRGVDVLKYLAIPKFESDNPTHQSISNLSEQIHSKFKIKDLDGVVDLEERLNLVVRELFE